MTVSITFCISTVNELLLCLDALLTISYGFYLILSLPVVRTSYVTVIILELRTVSYTVSSSAVSTH